MDDAGRSVQQLEHASQGLVETVQSFRLENERPHQQGRGLTAVAAVALPSSALGAACSRSPSPDGESSLPLSCRVRIGVYPRSLFDRKNFRSTPVLSFASTR